MKYQSQLNLLETEIAIKFIKDNFEKELAKALGLTRVSAPLFVLPETGLNDNLSGVERAVRFDVLDMGKEVEIVQSLAKWKRMALAKYGFSENTGLYTDMNAIRRDERLDAMHSIYVDQWDWEKIITKAQRKLSYLKKTVKGIYKAFLKVAKKVEDSYPQLKHNLPKDITFISTKELQEKYPDCDGKERERLAAKEYGAIFLYQIGWPLKDGKPHDTRAADYDDWKLNGDILVYFPVLDCALELSSMGIRVDEVALRAQLKAANCEERAELSFQKALLNGELPNTVGGGIGQSRLCMFFLRRAHIGEVQASIWTDETVQWAAEHGVNLL